MLPGLFWSLGGLLVPLGTRHKGRMQICSSVVLTAAPLNGTPAQINKPGKKIISLLPKHPEIHDLER